jgi:hypothetical protein
MAHDYVALRFAGVAGQAYLRELCGFDEAAVDDSFTPTAIRMLDRLLVDREACLPPGQSGRLSAFDRDRVLAAVYRRAFADRIDSTITCAACDNRFDLNFSLTALDAALDTGRAAAAYDIRSDGYVQTPDGAVFRLPNGREECVAAALPRARAHASIGAAVIDPSSRPVPAEELEELFERVAPLLDLPLDAACPECAHAQQVRFSVQSYLLESLVNERRRLIAEVHRLAVAYGWSHHEILELPRTARRQHVELIEAESARRQGVWR